MYQNSSTILELIAENERRRSDPSLHLVEALAADQSRSPGLRRAFASTIVRLGLRLHPAAGEGLPAFERPTKARARS